MSLADRGAVFSTLVLIPSPLELDIVRRVWGSDSLPRTELCGFGPIVAAARTSQLLASLSPKSVLLLGIAGSLMDSLKIGEAYQFGAVACYGIGVGEGTGFQSAGEIGWEQWSQDPTITDTLPLASAESQRLLLTACAASGSPAEAANRLAKNPSAQAEDMEGFAVAAACWLARVPLRIVRGISNRAGNRDHRLWQIEDALTSAVSLTKRVLEL